MATLMAGLVIEDPVEARDYFISRVIPAAAPYYEPIKICDPACGSGILLLSSASCFPDWANQLGLVQYFGQDIDEQCARMTKINCMLYGLNGFGYKLARAWAKAGVPAKEALTNLASPAETWKVLGGKEGGNTAVETSPSYEELFKPEQAEAEAELVLA